MFGMSAISTAVSSAQLNLYQFKLQQARRDAAQAQDDVRALEAQTDEARQKAARAQDKVDALERRPPGKEVTLNTSGQFTGAVLNATA